MVDNRYLFEVTLFFILVIILEDWRCDRSILCSLATFQICVRWNLTVTIYCQNILIATCLLISGEWSLAKIYDRAAKFYCWLFSLVDT